MNHNPSLVTAAAIASELSLESPEFVKALARKRKIPSVRLGHRTVRFDLAKVRTALEKLEVRSV